MIRITVALSLALLAADGLGQSNQALFVDGLDSAVKVPKHLSLEPPAAMTLECWVKGLGSNEHGRIIRKESGKGYDLSWSFQHDEVSALYVCSGQYVAYDTVPNDSLVGEWHHLAMTCVAGGYIRYYRDGELITESAGPPCMEHASDLYFGTDPSGSEEFIGTIDEIRLWNVERTPQQIKDSYLLVLDSGPGLVAVWHLDGDAIDVVSGNVGTLQGNAHFISSDAPIGFSYTPSRGDWQGGTQVTLTGFFTDVPDPPVVMFGDVPAASAQLVNPSTIVAVTPAGAHPGQQVGLSVLRAAGTQPGVGMFLYTPALTASPSVSPGGNLQIDLDFLPAATVAVFLGTELRGTPGYPWAWHPECVPSLRVFLAHAPFQDQVGFRMQIPDGFTAGELVITAQGIVVDAESGKGSFTNGAAISILSE